MSTFQFYQLTDLTAVNSEADPTWPKLNGKYAIFPGNKGQGFEVRQNQTLLVKHIIPFAYARYPDEGNGGVVALASGDVCGQFVYQPVVTNGGGKWYLKGSQPGIAIYGAEDNATQADMKEQGGIYGVVDNPLDTVNVCLAGSRPESRGLGIEVPGGQHFNVLFSIVQQGHGTGANGIDLPIPYRFSVGGATPGTRRVDFAGVYVLGELT